MSDSIEGDNFRERLMAFADGELGAAESLPVLEYLSAHPEAMDWVKAQQRLRIAARRAARAGVPRAPEGLRQRVAALPAPAGPAPAPDAGAPGPAALQGRRAIPAPRARWRAAAVAAGILAAGLGAGWLLRGRQVAPEVRDTKAETAAPVLPADVVASASFTHADCSRLAAARHSAPFPVGALRQSVQEDLGRPFPFPDFSGLGYAYVGAGPCAKPCENAIHLLYRNAQGDAISVFVQPWAGQYALAPGRLYAASGPDSPFPMLAWRTSRVVYFLLADDRETLERARRAISIAPNL